VSLVRSAISRRSNARWRQTRERISCGSREGVDLLLQAEQGHAAGLQLLDDGDEFGEGAAEPDDRQCVASAGIGEKFQAGLSPARRAGPGGAEPRAEAEARHAADPLRRVHRGQSGRLPLQPSSSVVAVVCAGQGAHKVEKASAHLSARQARE
jgi:hypothetical protein